MATLDIESAAPGLKTLYVNMALEKAGIDPISTNYVEDLPGIRSAFQKLCQKYNGEGLWFDKNGMVCAQIKKDGRIEKNTDATTAIICCISYSFLEKEI